MNYCPTANKDKLNLLAAQTAKDNFEKVYGLWTI